MIMIMILVVIEAAMAHKNFGRSTRGFFGVISDATFESIKQVEETKSMSTGTQCPNILLNYDLVQLRISEDQAIELCKW